MSNERNGTNGAPAGGLTPRTVDASGRLVPISDEERRARLPLELASLEAAWDIPPDETETDEAWDEVLRNLGVDPATGRGLPTRRGVRIGRSTPAEVRDREHHREQP
jgi:hypothetical protein